MRKLIEFNPNTNPSEPYFEKLGKKEQEVLNKFEKYCRVSAGESRAKKSKTNALRFLVMANKPLDKIGLDDLREFLRVLKEGDFSDYFKNDVKGFVQRFLKWYYKDWSERFNNFEDVKFNSDATRKNKITSKDVLSKEEVERLIKSEPSIYYKTFIAVQYGGGLRTLETRSLRWDMIDDSDEDVYFLKVVSKKNKNGTEKERLSIPLDEKVVYYLKEQKKSQREKGINSPYVFNSFEDENSFVSSGTISKWFSRLTKKVLGQAKTNYILRHSRGETLHEMVRDGQLSKENAVLMMGHSEKMFDKTYSHADRGKLKEVLKKQVLNTDYIPPEIEKGLREIVEKQGEEIQRLKEMIFEMKNSREVIHL